MRAVIVEDYPDFAALRDLLVRHGFEVAVATTGLEATRLLAGPPPDVALLDIGLPDLSGRDVIRFVAQWSPALVRKMVVYTGYDDECLRAELEHLGVARFLREPLDAADLLAAVRSAAGT